MKGFIPSITELYYYYYHVLAQLAPRCLASTLVYNVYAVHT